MLKLWGKWWVRLPVGILAAPVIMSAAFIAGGAAYTIFTAGFGGLTSSDFVPPPNLIPFMLLIEWGLCAPMWIGMEVFNFMRGRPMPPAICAGFLAVFSIVFVVCVMIDTAAKALPVNPVLRIVIVIGIALAAAFGATFPFYRRWQKHTPTAAETSALF